MNFSPEGVSPNFFDAAMRILFMVLDAVFEKESSISWEHSAGKHMPLIKPAGKSVRFNIKFV